MSRRLDKVTWYVTLAVPNLEVEYIYRNTITSWFHEEMKERDLSVMYQAMQTGDIGIYQTELSRLLQISISYMDSKEAFYHGFFVMPECKLSANCIGTEGVRNLQGTGSGQ